VTAGVSVQLTPGATLIVEGNLRTSGAEERPVVLESAEAWNGIECGDHSYVDFSNPVFVDATATECV